MAVVLALDYQRLIVLLLVVLQQVMCLSFNFPLAIYFVIRIERFRIGVVLW